MNDQLTGARCLGTNPAAEQMSQSQGAICGGAYIGLDQQAKRCVRVEVEVDASHDFGAALFAAKSGHRITRRGWNAGGQYVSAQRCDKFSKMTEPYLYIKNAQGGLIPWVPSQGDLFANDWAILPIQPA